MKKLLLYLLLLLSVQSYAQDEIRMCEEPPITAEFEEISRGMIVRSKLWDNGTTLRVRFLDGSSYLQNRVLSMASTWSEHANIKFTKVTTGPSEVIVSFSSGSGSWSYLGTDCRLMAASGKVTMNLGWLTDNSSEMELRRVVLHEFGHTLGLSHEHLNPLKKFTWDEEAVKKYYLQRGWTLENIQRNMLDKYSQDLTNGEYDPYSIMHYAVPNSLTVEDYEVEWNSVLSFRDKLLIAKLYPKFVATETTGNRLEKLIGSTNIKVTSCAIQNIATTLYNVDDVTNRIDMKVDFQVNNSAYKRVGVRVDYYDEYGNDLKTSDINFKQDNGQLSAVKYIYLPNEDNYTGNLSVSLPVDVLEKSTSASKIMFRVVVTVSGLEYCNTGKYSLELKKGQNKTVIKSLELKTELDNANRRFKMIPRFTVENAKGRKLKACIYFYDADKNILRDNSGGVQSWCTEFEPYSNSAIYYTGNLLSVYVPYSEINMPYGKHDMKYFLALWENGVQIATGTWNTISMTR